MNDLVDQVRKRRPGTPPIKFFDLMVLEHMIQLNELIHVLSFWSTLPFKGIGTYNIQAHDPTHSCPLLLTHMNHRPR